MKLRPLSVATLGVALALSACNKTSEKVDRTKVSSEKTEIPDNMAANPMFVGRDQPPAGLEVRGRDGGGAPLADGSAPAAEAAPGITLVDAGAEPKAVRAWTLSGKDVRAIGIKAKITQEIGGQSKSADAPALRVTFALATKKDGKGFVVTGTVLKAAVNVDAGGDPRMAAMAGALEGAAGLAFEAPLSAQGEFGAVKLNAEAAKDPRAGAQVVQMLPEFLQALMIPLPKEAIGVGATWTETIREGTGPKASTSTRTFHLDKVDGDKLVVRAEIVKSTPKQALAEQGAPPGTTVEASGKGSTTYSFALGHFPAKVDGSTEDKSTITLPEGKGAQSQTTTVGVTVEEADAKDAPKK